MKKNVKKITAGFLFALGVYAAGNMHLQAEAAAPVETTATKTAMEETTGVDTGTDLEKTAVAEVADVADVAVKVADAQLQVLTEVATAAVESDTSATADEAGAIDAGASVTGTIIQAVGNAAADAVLEEAAANEVATASEAATVGATAADTEMAVANAGGTDAAKETTVNAAGGTAAADAGTTNAATGTDLANAGGAETATSAQQAAAETQAAVITQNTWKLLSMDKARLSATRSLAANAAKVWGAVPINQTAIREATQAAQAAAQATTAAKAAESAVTAATAAATATKPAVPTIGGLEYTKTLNVTASAYGPGNIMWQWGGHTFSGTKVREGVIAVDPSVIPLGTKVYITGYNTPLLPAGGFVAVAEDTGGLIKGNRIDIYIDGTQAQLLQFGMQDVKLYVLK